MTTTLRHYLRKKPSLSNHKGEPYGVLMARLVDNEVFLSWSLCHRNDTFSKEQAEIEAIKRMVPSKNCTPAALAFKKDHIPHDVKKEMPSFIERCKKYYKQATVDA